MKASRKFQLASQKLTAAFAGIVIVSSAAALLAQQRDTTTTPQKPSGGTGEISGVVVTATSNPQPLRRAVVTLAGGIPISRSVLTDDAGRFSFTKLPAGTFQVTARKAAYLAAAFGARRPGRAGTSIALADGQRVNLTISMFKGAAISGVLRDASGQPAGGVDVRAIDVRRLATGQESNAPDVATTDDRGIFRLYGLLPGDYVVVGLPLPATQGEITAPSTTFIDAALSRLGSRQSIGAAASPASAAALPPQRSIGFAPVFYPGTAISTEAVRVHVEPGDERTGVDFAVTPVTVASIEGTVTGVPSMAGVQVTLISSGPRVANVISSSSLAGKPLDAEGNFRYSNLAPGRYRVVARARRGEAPPAPGSPLISTTVVSGGGGGGGTPPGAAGGASDYLFAFADVDIRGDDVTGIALALQPGGTISGRIVFAGTGTTPKPQDMTAIRTALNVDGATGMVSSNGLTMGNGLITNPPYTVQSDATFDIRGIGPARFNFAPSVPAGSKGWILRSAKVGDRDLLDEALELGPGIVIRNVTVTFTDVHTELSGTLQSGAGQPLTDYYIVALPADRGLWRPKARRILSTRPASDGRFVFADLPAGEYVIAALTDLDPIDLADMNFLDQIAPAGAKVTVAEGEKKVQDLRIR